MRATIQSLNVSPNAIAMLRITTVKTDKRHRLVLEGKLASPWVTELTKLWNDVRATATDLTVIVDLRNVTMISEDGEHILLKMMGEGVRFVCAGILNKYVLRRLEQKHLRAMSSARSLVAKKRKTE